MLLNNILRLKFLIHVLILGLYIISIDLYAKFRQNSFCWKAQFC